MKRKTLETEPESSDRYDSVVDQLALNKLIKHGIITTPPDSLGFLNIVKLPPSLPLPFPDLKFDKIPHRYDTKAYLLYLGFQEDQAELIFDKCKSESEQPSDINVATLTKCANEHVAEFFHEPIWATVLDVSLVSEIARLKARMQGFLSEQTELEEPSLTTLPIEDYIKQAIWQRSTNLTEFQAIVHDNLD